MRPHLGVVSAPPCGAPLGFDPVASPLEHQALVPELADERLVGASLPRLSGDVRNKLIAEDIRPHVLQRLRRPPAAARRGDIGTPLFPGVDRLFLKARPNRCSWSAVGARRRKTVCTRGVPWPVSHHRFNRSTRARLAAYVAGTSFEGIPVSESRNTRVRKPIEYGDMAPPPGGVSRSVDYVQVQTAQGIRKLCR